MKKILNLPCSITTAVNRNVLGIHTTAAGNNEEKNTSREVLSNSHIRVNGNRTRKTHQQNILKRLKK